MREFRQIQSEDLMCLCRFLDRFDQKRTGLLEEHDRYGHVDLPLYTPWMGPRYHPTGHDFPLSVFRGEGMALFLLMRILQPKVIVECFTGTGVSGIFLAAGAPQARVLSIDNYTEGSRKKEGLAAAMELRDQMGLNNLELYEGAPEDLSQILQDLSPVDVYFSDGPYIGVPVLLSEDAVVIRQDDMNGQIASRSFSILGGSHLSVMCSTSSERVTLMSMMAKVFPVEWCDA